MPGAALAEEEAGVRQDEALPAGVAQAVEVVEVRAVPDHLERPTRPRAECAQLLLTCQIALVDLSGSIRFQM